MARLGKKVPVSQPAKGQEASMEEILASIRRIISDDDAGKPAFPKPASAPKQAAAASAKNAQADIDAAPASFDAADGQEPNGAPAQAQVGTEVSEQADAMQAEAPAFNGIDRPTDPVFDETPEHARPLQEPPDMPAPDRPLL